MTIKPKDANKLSKKDEQAVKKLEKIIDQALIGGERTFFGDMFPNMKVADKITTIYSKAGWLTNYVQNNVSGDYLCIYEKHKVQPRVREPNNTFGEMRDNNLDDRGFFRDSCFFHYKRDLMGDI